MPYPSSSTIRSSDGLLSGQRPPHDPPNLSSGISSQRFCHQSGAHGRKAPDVLFFFHHLLLLFFLLPFISQCYDPAQPLLFIHGDPVPLFTSNHLRLFSSSQRLLNPKLPSCSQVGSFILFTCIGTNLIITIESLATTNFY